MAKGGLLQDLDRQGLVSIVMVVIVLIFGGRLIYANRSEQLNSVYAGQKKAQLCNEIGKLREKYDSYENNLPEVKETAWLLGEVAKIANQNRIKLQSIQPKPMVREKDIIRFAISLSIRCTYHELGGFISRLESSKKFIHVDRFNVNSKGSDETMESNDSPTADVQMELSTFVFNRLSGQ